MRFNIILIFVVSLYAFKYKDIDRYINSKNPYIKAIEAQIAKAKAKAQQANSFLDTRFSLGYEYKEYPLSFSKYQEAKFLQNSKNGLSISFSYRKAEGVQEYNNIKTGKEGEYLLNLKISLVKFLNGLGKNGYILKKASIKGDIEKFYKYWELLDFEAMVKKRYFKLMEIKWEIEFYKELLLISKKNLNLIKEGVKKGQFAKVDIVKSKAFLESIKERLLFKNEVFSNLKREFFKYLNAPLLKIELQEALDVKTASFDEVFKKSLCFFPYLKALKEELKEVKIEKRFLKNALFPRADINLYKNYDISYKKWGDKISIELSYPLQNREYRFKKEELRAKKLYLKALYQKAVLNLRVSLENIISSMKFLKKRIKSKKREKRFNLALYEAEFKRYKSGLGNLFLVNEALKNLLASKIEIKRLEFELSRLKVDLDSLTGEL